MALTAGGPVVIPKIVNGRNKLFFFGSYSYVNDFIPGKNQASSTVPASAAQLNGDFSDLLRLPNPAQYQIYDPLTVRPDPANPNRFIRNPFPNNIIPANRIVNPLYNLYRQMVPPPNQNLIENGTTPSGNYYRGGEPDKPVSSLYAGRMDYNLSGNDRFFFRVSGNTFIEPVSDWTYEVPEFEGLHSIDRSRYNWAVIGNWTHVAGKTLIDTQIASNRFWQDDKLLRLHDYKPSDMGLPAYLDAFCAAQSDCMLPAVNIGGYQGISQGAVSGDTTTNLQGTVNVTQVRGAHTLRGGVDARLAQRKRGPGGNPSGQLSFTNEFTRQASDTSQLTPSNLGLSLAAFMLGIPSTSSATIQPTVNLRNHFFAAYVQDTWRLNNLTLNLGLRFEWENGISEDNGEIVVDFDPNAKLAISDLAEAAYARAPIPQLPAADFHVRGGSVYATDPGQDGTVWRPQALWMPRVSAAYKLGDKTVLKAGYGIYYDTLNAADFNQNNPGFSSTTTNTNSTNFGQTFLLGNPYAGQLGISDPFPIRADGTRFDEPTGSSLGIDTIAGSALHDPEPEPRARAPAAVAVRGPAGGGQEPVGGGGLRRLVFGSDRVEHPAGLPAAAVLDSGQPERARCGHADAPHRERDEPVYARELRGAEDDRPRAVSADVRQRLLHGDDDAAEPPAAAVLADQQPDLQQPAAWRGQGAFAPGQCEPPLFWRVHRQRGDVVQQQPGESYGRGVRPRADVVVGRQQQPAVPPVRRRGV